jgi:hypothetical protein
MKVDMYLRTCEKDYAWLPYLFASIKKFATGYERIIVQAPVNQPRPPLPDWPCLAFAPAPDYGTGTNVNTGMPDDYNGQQMDKLLSFQFSLSDAILFLDSDCVFTRQVDVSNDPDLWDGERPILWHTPWQDVGPAQCWHDMVEKILGWDPEAETMRRHPFIHLTELLNRLGAHIVFERGIDLMGCDRISEFNLMGNYALAKRRAEYTPRDTRGGMPAPLMYIGGGLPVKKGIVTAHLRSGVTVRFGAMVTNSMVFWKPPRPLTAKQAKRKRELQRRKARQVIRVFVPSVEIRYPQEVRWIGDEP